MELAPRASAHPICDATPCSVLQFADDTLIMIRGNTQGVAVFKTLLDGFTKATGLALNYHKTTFIPLNIPPEEASTMAAILGCPISSFP